MATKRTHEDIQDEEEQLQQQEDNPTNSSECCWDELNVVVGSARCDVAVVPRPEVPSGVAAPNFPRVLSVVGFVGAAQIASPPSLSVHHVVPNCTNDRSPQAKAEHAMFALLHRTLVCEHQHALVALGHRWFALLTAPPLRAFAGSGVAVEGTEPLVLLLHVLAPGTVLPGTPRALSTFALAHRAGPCMQPAT